MARFSLALAAATVAATALTASLAANPAQAQVSPYGTPVAPPPGYQVAPPVPTTGGYPPPTRVPGGYPPPPAMQQGMPPAHVPPAPMGAAPMAPPMGGPQTTYGAPTTVPTPAQPFSNLQLPRENVGDGAYNGGGVVLEYMPDGTRRVVPR